MNESTSNHSGCVILLLVGLALVAVLYLAIGYAADGRARQVEAQAHLEYSRGQAQAMVIQAEAQSRQSTAIANAVISAALLPWGVLFTVSILGLAVIALIIFLVANRRHLQPVEVERVVVERIETRTIVYLPGPDQPRRVLWQTLSNHQALDDGTTGQLLIVPGQKTEVGQ